MHQSFSKTIVRALCISLLMTLPVFSQNGPTVGAVYTQSNSPSGNSVLVYDRLPDGTIRASASVATGGSGSAGPLPSEGSVALSANHRWLLVANAGSDNVTVFSLEHGRPIAVGTTASGGHFPYSIAVHEDLVYVLNAGAPGGAAASTVTGFRLDPFGNLTPIAGSTRGLSAPFVDPAQVGFNPDGTVLVVTERGTTLISGFPVHSDGTLGTRVSTASAGLWPYGFAFGIKNQLVVSEAVAMLPYQSSVSSYVVHSDGSLTTVTAASPTHQTAACWVAVSSGGRYAYVTDAFTNAISGFSIDRSGAIALLDADGRTASTPTGFPVDVSFSNDGRYLYTLTLLGSGITSFRVAPDGSLSEVQRVGLTGFPSGMVVK